MRLTLIISALLLCLCAQGQVFKGTIVDGESAKPLPMVAIINHTTQQTTSSDAAGNYSIKAGPGDLLSFAFIGYNTKKMTLAPNTDGWVELYPLNVKLKEFIVHPGYTPYQEDSAALTKTYEHELKKEAIKPGFSSANGGGFSGLIGGPIQKMSKSYKRNERFKENFKHDMEQKFIDTRYTPGLTTALTGFTGDTLAVFMNTYPMEYKFARIATDLEIKMWIRNNYKEYLKSQPVIIKEVKTEK